jgi:hypothetical protein
MGANPSRIRLILPAAFTNDYKAGLAATFDLQPLSRMQACQRNWQLHRRQNSEAMMKALFFSMALAAGLALWGSEPQAGIDQLMAASSFAGQQVYNILH